VNSAGSIKGATALAALGQSKALSTNVDALFDAGKMPFYITRPWSIDKAKKVGIKYAISPLPSLTDGGKMQPFLGIQMFYVSAKAKNAAFAQEFVTQYVPREDVQLALFVAGHRPASPDLGLCQSRFERSGRCGMVRGRQGWPGHAQHPGHELGVGPLDQAEADVIAGKAQPQARFDAAQKEIVANIAKG
jgi:arabinogalactan oligomer/maltooligosaccharide transport system substrate-binding protein